jgi:hypothetical protein
MGCSFTINMPECSLAVAVVFIPVLWHRFFRPSLRRLILELKADSYNLGLRDGEERARQKALQKQSRDDHVTLDALHMRIDVLSESITELMEETRSLLERIKEDEEEGHDDTHSHRSGSSDSDDAQFSTTYFSDGSTHPGFGRHGFTSELMRRQDNDELEVGEQGRGGALMMGIGGQEFLETPD